MITQNVKTLLPIKQKDGKWIYPTEVVPDEASEHDSEEETVENEEESKEESVDDGSLIQFYARERAKLKQIKFKVGLLCSSITGDPENHSHGLKVLLEMLKNPSTEMIVSEKKILAFSILHVFTDVLPGYKIRKIEEDKKSKLKKETKRLLNYELELVRYYKKYIDILQIMVNDMKSKAKPKKTGVSSLKKALDEVGIVATKCLCELLVKRYYFNYSKTIINLVVPLGCSKNSVVSDLCCTALGGLYKEDKLGEASLDAVKLTVKLLKERQFNIPPQLLQTFLSLKLKEVQLQKETKVDMNKARRQLNTMSRKEKKYKKRMKGLEKQLRETEAEESRDNKCKLQTEILKKIFWVYFHILKDDKKQLLISPVLEGLSKFAHLINLEFFDDLCRVLCGLMEFGNLSNTEKLYCMQTVFVILSGQAESLNIDPQRLYSYLYNILLNLENGHSLEHYNAALKCTDFMLRKRKITQNRALAFIKRLCVVSLNTPVHFTLAALSLARAMMINTKNSDLLLDAESMVGTGLYLPEVEDPEYCNASATCVWELLLLLKHSNTNVSTFAKHILAGCPLQGRLQLPGAFLNCKPSEILEQYAEMASGENIVLEECKRPAKRRRIQNDEPLCIPEQKLDTDITYDDVKNANFADIRVNH